jgi:hypothetical protein
VIVTEGSDRLRTARFARVEPAVSKPLLETVEAREHLRTTVSTWLGVPTHTRVEIPSLPESLARLLLRVEEYERPHRDQWNCWEYAFSENHRRGALWVSEVDEWLADRRRELAARMQLEPLWPGDHPFVVCLTHDVDMISRQRSPAQAVRAARAGLTRLPAGANSMSRRLLRGARALGGSAYYGLSRAPATLDTLQRSIELEQSYGVTSSYLFTVYPPRTTPYDCVYRASDACVFRGVPMSVGELVRSISAEGFDVGLHGSYLSALEPDLLAEERATLEDVVERPVETLRQHYLHFDIRKTPRLQERSGLQVDSTLGFNRNVGFRAGTSLPFRLFDFESNSPIGVLEVPLVIQESPLLASNSLELDVELAEQVIAHFLDATARVGGVLTLLFHPHSFLKPSFVSLFRFAIEYGLERGAWFASLAEIGSWWREREARLEVESQEVARQTARERQ